MIPDLLIRAALICAGVSALLIGFTIAFAPHVFFVVFRFVSAAIILTVACAFALVALACLGLAHIGVNANGVGDGWVIAAIVIAILVIEARRRRTPLAVNREPPRSAQRRAVLPPSRSSSDADDAEAALRNLGFDARDARVAVASAVATLSDDADLASIIKTALRAQRS
jgi:hypothetical protein